MPEVAPEPERVAESCPLDCASPTVSVPVRVQDAVGVNVTLMLHVPRPAMTGQLLAALKSLRSAMLMPVTANTFGLLTITVCVGLELPRGTLPKLSPAMLDARVDAKETTLCVTCGAAAKFAFPP